MAYGNSLREYTIADCHRRKIIIQNIGWLEDYEVPIALSGAEGLIFISDGEGFGLPILEAMACQTPVLCSKVDSLPEVGGDCVQYIVKHNETGLHDALTTVIPD